MDTHSGPPESHASIVRVIDYHASRLLCLRAALTSFFRRWALYVLIGIVVFSAGTNAPLVIALGLASSLSWPLRLAAAHGWTIVPAVVAYAVVGTLPVVMTRPLWWPHRWAEAERALPIATDVTRRSDFIFAALMMAPWQVALALGAFGGVFAVSFDASTPPHPADVRLVLTGWFASIVASLWLSSRWMRMVRDRAALSSASRIGLGMAREGASRRGVPRRGPTGIRKVDVRVALVVLPLWRGRAKRTAVALTLGSFATLASATSARWSNLSIGWTFALTAVVASSFTSVLRVATVRELQPFWRGSRSVPIDVRACEAARLLIITLPMIAGVIGCLASAAGEVVPVRPQVVALFVAMLLAGCIVEAVTPRTAQPQDHAARWLLMLIAAIAFASEVSSS